jgi:hypothetical protein
VVSEQFIKVSLIFQQSIIRETELIHQSLHQYRHEFLHNNVDVDVDVNAHGIVSHGNCQWSRNFCSKQSQWHGYGRHVR